MSITEDKFSSIRKAIIVILLHIRIKFSSLNIQNRNKSQRNPRSFHVSCCFLFLYILPLVPNIDFKKETQIQHSQHESQTELTVRCSRCLHCGASPTFRFLNGLLTGMFGVSKYLRKVWATGINIWRILFFAESDKHIVLSVHETNGIPSNWKDLLPF